jgi:hypothetical protein
MTTVLATIETDRLAKLLRLALGSDKDGEIIGAVVALKRTLAAAGLDTHWIVDAFERGAAPAVQQPRNKSDERNDRSAAWFAFHRSHRLSSKERKFIESIVQWTAPLSDKQRQWLHDICDRLVAS